MPLNLGYNYAQFPDGLIQLVGNSAGAINTSVLLNNIPDVTQAQLSAGVTLNDKVFLYNSSTQTWKNPQVQVTATVAGDRWCVGGATESTNPIATFTTPSFSPTTIRVVSSAVGDTTQTCTVFGYDTSATPVTVGRNAAVTLNGTTQVTLAGNYAYVYKVTLSAAAAGTVTVSTTGGTTITTVTIGALITSHSLTPGQVITHVDTLTLTGIPIWIQRVIAVNTPPAGGLFELFNIGHAP